MFYKSSRKLLCFLLTALMVVGICIFEGATLVRSTLCNQNYMQMFFNTERLDEYCNDVYADQIGVLCENSGIPSRVFEASEDTEGYSESAVTKFFNGSDTQLMTRDRINIYENLIKEYLDGNSISYDSALVHNTAVRAAEIYADSYGLKNVGTFRSFVSSTTAMYGQLSSAGAMIMLVPALLIYIIFTDKKEVKRHYLSAVSASGLTFVLVGILSLIFSVGKGAVITPEIYQVLTMRAISVMFLLLVLEGVLVCAVSTVLLLRIHKLTKRTRNK